MKRAICFMLLCLFIFSGSIKAQASLDIGGEIETLLNFDLDESGKIWPRTKFELKLDHQASDNVDAYVNLKINTGEAFQFDWKLNEAYVDYYGNDYDLRTGMQIISWGTAYSINPTDNINPFDLSEEGAFIPEEKLGVTAVQLKYYPIANLTLTGVYIPYFVPALEMVGVPLPEKKLENSEYAFKLTAQSIMGCDLSVSYFKGKEDYPWINGKYRDIQIYGGDVIGTIGEIAFWAEGAYTRPEIGDSYYQIAVGGEYTFGNDLYFMGQIYHRNYPDAKENYLMTVLRYPLRDIHTLQLGVAYETENKIFIVFPEVNLSLADATSLVLGGIFVKGDTAGTFMSQIKDKIFLKLEYSF